MLGLEESGVGREGERRRGEDPLVDHERADLDLLPFQLPGVDQRVLLVKECDERRSIVPSIAFRREDEPGKLVRRGIGRVYIYECKTYSRDWNLLNSPLSKRIWNAVQTKGAAASVLLTVSFPKEKLVPMGWSM